jgi:hypothetical protein
MRLDGVEVKVTLQADQVPAVLERLGLGERTRLDVWFCDDLTTGTDLPLLAAGVVVRLRVPHGAHGGPGHGDSVVKLRPCRRSQLTARWLRSESGVDDDLELRLEEDWAGVRRVLAASAQARLPKDVPPLTHRGPLPGDVLGKAQVAYLDDCAPLRVNPDQLCTLGPIKADRWASMASPDLAALGVRAERWRVADLDFLELSVKVTRENAQAAQARLDDAVSALGIAPDKDQETKTRRVLDALAHDGT